MLPMIVLSKNKILYIAKLNIECVKSILHLVLSQLIRYVNYKQTDKSI